jgi:hypothetical protein
MSKYEIRVNGKPTHIRAVIEAASREQAVNIWLTQAYGSPMSPRAPYNVSAIKIAH